MIRKLLAVSCLLVSQWAGAAPVIHSTVGLAAPVSTITFDEHVLATNAVVTNQFAAEGISFDSNLCYTPQTGFTNIVGKDVGNFPCTGSPGPVSFLMNLTVAQSGVAFAMVSNSTTWLFEALLGGVVQDSFSTNVNVGADNFFGFTGVAMDAIRISGRDFMLIDNVQLGGAVQLPEPVSLSLVALALVGAGAASRRRSR